MEQTSKPKKSVESTIPMVHRNLDEKPLIVEDISDNSDKEVTSSLSTLDNVESAPPTVYHNLEIPFSRMGPIDSSDEEEPSSSRRSFIRQEIQATIHPSPEDKLRSRTETTDDSDHEATCSQGASEGSKELTGSRDDAGIGSTSGLLPQQRRRKINLEDFDSITVAPSPKKRQRGRQAGINPGTLDYPIEIDAHIGGRGFSQHSFSADYTAGSNMYPEWLDIKEEYYEKGQLMLMIIFVILPLALLLMMWIINPGKNGK